jgi:hypothetical protein
MFSHSRSPVALPVRVSVRSPAELSENNLSPVAEMDVLVAFSEVPEAMMPDYPSVTFVPVVVDVHVINEQ